MDKKISVLIPTYNSPDSLDLLLRSLIEGSDGIDDYEIIVGVDGTLDINEAILSKYSSHVKSLILDENVGLCRMTNLLVYNASYELILILNDDNIAPKYWNANLNSLDIDGCVISPNQIEPIPSIFPQFHIKNCGRDPKIFDLEQFWNISESLNVNLLLASKPSIDETGSTLPIFMNKLDFMRVGGWDETYPQGMVADCDFFKKCRISGLKMKRTYNTHFYHFVSLSVNSEKRSIAEREGHEFYHYKWGNYMQRDQNNNIY